MWGLFHLADVLNLEYNALPSLHVAFAITTAEVGQFSPPIHAGRGCSDRHRAECHSRTALQAISGTG